MLQVLAPMYKGPAGIDKLNEVLQELFNPTSEQEESLSTEILHTAVEIKCCSL